MWTLKKGPKAVRLTKRLAGTFATMERCPHDRELQERRLEHICRLVEEGRLRPPEWVSAFCAENGLTYRVNGKHTSTFLAGMDKIPSIKVIVSEYHCDDLQDVADLYATFDARFSSRSPRDIYTVFGQTVSGLEDVQSHIFALCAAGIGFAKYELGAAKVPTERKARHMIEYPDFVLFVSGLDIRNKENKYMARGCVVAAMYKIWQKSKTHCVNFWKVVRDGSDDDPKSPTRILQRWLMTNVLTGKNVLMSEGNRVTDHEMMARSIMAFNAWRKNQPLKDFRYFADKETPEVA